MHPLKTKKMSSIRDNFNQSLKNFIQNNGGDISECLDMGDLITEASRIADELEINPPNLNYVKYYSTEIYKLQVRDLTGNSADKTLLLYL